MSYVWSDEQCPERGVLLNHTLTPSGRCPSCNANVRPASERNWSNTPNADHTFREAGIPPMPPLDVAARLQAIGLGAQAVVDRGPEFDVQWPLRAGRMARHQMDNRAGELHAIGTWMMPHNHEIREDWTHSLKQRAGDHIDRFHSG
jgi:hypothetical protein